MVKPKRTLHSNTGGGSGSSSSKPSTPQSATKRTSCKRQIIEAVTELIDTNYEFSWIIKNFKEIKAKKQDDDGFSLISSLFEVGLEPQYKWRINLQIEKDKEIMIEEDEYISLYLQLDDKVENGVSIIRSHEEPRPKYKMKFQVNFYGSPNDEFNGNDEKLLESAEAVFEMGVGDETWGWEDFIDCEKLAEIENGSIKIQVVYTTQEIIKRKLRKYSFPLEEKLDSTTKLVADFNNLRSSGLQSDIVIVVNETEIKAHKAILSARSPVFQRMFDVDMSEKNSGIIKIDEFNKDVVEAMLDYIYTNDTKAVTENTSEMLQISEKYELTELKDKCERVFIEKMSIDNAAEILVLADMYNTRFLKNVVLKFINRNKDQVAKTAVFKNLVTSKSPILIELYMAEFEGNN